MTDGNTNLSATPPTKPETESERLFLFQAGTLTQALQNVLFTRASEVEDLGKKKEILQCQINVSAAMERILR